MNIFVTSFNFKELSSHLDDLRLNKMILETAQLLSSAYRHMFNDIPELYRETHSNHPCSIWARQNIDTYSWLVCYFNALAQEKIRRDKSRQKPQHTQFHKSWRELFPVFQIKTTNDYKDKICMEFFNFNCTDFKDEKDIRVAYQKHLIFKWQNDIKQPMWTAVVKPYFYI